MGTKKIKIDFFRVDLGSSDPKKFREYLGAIQKTSYDKKLWKWYDDWFRIDNIRINEKSCYGEFMRLKPEVAARIIFLEKEGVHDMELPPDSFVGGGLPFMYFDECETLIMQRDRNMANHWRIAEYIRNIGGCSYLIVTPIMKGNLQLSSFKKIYKFELSTAMPKNQKVTEIGTGDALDLMNIYNAHNINICLSANRGKSVVPLDRDVVIQTIERAGLMGMRPRKNKVTGQISEALENEVLDLIKDKLEHEVTIPFSGREPLPHEIAPFLQTAYDKYASKLDVKPKS